MPFDTFNNEDPVIIDCDTRSDTRRGGVDTGLKFQLLIIVTMALVAVTPIVDCVEEVVDQSWIGSIQERGEVTTGFTDCSTDTFFCSDHF